MKLATEEGGRSTRLSGRWDFSPEEMSVQAGWCPVGLEKFAGARCARIGTAGRAEPRDGGSMALLAGQEEEFLEVIKDISVGRISERIMDETVELAGLLRLKDATSAAASAVGNSAVEPWPSGIAKHSASTGSVVAASSSGDDTPQLQQSQSSLLKLGLPGVRNTAPQLDLLGPELVARPMQPLLQMKLDLQGLRSTAPRQNQRSQCRLLKLDLLGPVPMSTSTAEMAAGAKSVVEARPFGIAKYSAKTESALEVLPGEAGSSGSRAGGTT